MKPCHQHHRQPLLPAMGVSAALLAAILGFLPLHWVGWIFVRSVHRPEPVQIPIVDGRWTRLLPVPAAPSTISEQVIRFAPVREAESDAPGGAENRFRWTYDPLTPGRIADDLFDRLAFAPPDSVIRRATFLNSLRLTGLDPSLAIIDTSQVALAKEQFRGILAWQGRTMGPLWTAQGQGARNAAIFERAVTEAAREGVQ